MNLRSGKHYWRNFPAVRVAIVIGPSARVLGNTLTGRVLRNNICLIWFIYPRNDFHSPRYYCKQHIRRQYNQEKQQQQNSPSDRNCDFLFTTRKKTKQKISTQKGHDLADGFQSSVIEVGRTVMISLKVALLGDGEQEKISPTTVSYADGVVLCVVIVNSGSDNGNENKISFDGEMLSTTFNGKRNTTHG